MEKYSVKTQRKFVPFVFIATILIFAGGLIALINKFLSGKEEYLGFNIYYLALIFSVVLLFKALTEKGFNPGNYLFYCIIVLLAGIILENNLKKMIYNGKPMSLVAIVFLIGLIIIGTVSNYFYIHTMNKGERALEEKDAEEKSKLEK